MMMAALRQEAVALAEALLGGASAADAATATRLESGKNKTGGHMQRAVRQYLVAFEAGDAEKAAALFIADGWVQSPFLGRVPVRDYVAKVAGASSRAKLTVHDVLVSAEGHLRAVAYYLYDWWLKDGSNVSFECADVFNFDPNTGRIASIVLVYDTHFVRGVVDRKYP
jgi:hypothetical protein